MLLMLHVFGIMLYLMRFDHLPLLPLSVRSSNPISSPMHTHISLNIFLAFSVVLDPFSVPGYSNWLTITVLLCLRVTALIKGRLSAIQLQSE